MMPFDTMPLSALIHELLYARGHGDIPQPQGYAERGAGAQLDGQQIV